MFCVPSTLRKTLSQRKLLGEHHVMHKPVRSMQRVSIGEATEISYGKPGGGGDETKMEKSSVVCSSLAGKTGCPGANGAATVAAGVAAKGSRGASQGQRQLRVGRADGHALTPGTRGIRAKQTGSWPTPPLPGASHQRCGRNPPQVLVFRFPVECTTLGSM